MESTGYRPAGSGDEKVMCGITAAKGFEVARALSVIDTNTLR